MSADDYQEESKEEVTFDEIFPEIAASREWCDLAIQHEDMIDTLQDQVQALKRELARRQDYWNDKELALKRDLARVQECWDNQRLAVKRELAQKQDECEKAWAAYCTAEKERQDAVHEAKRQRQSVKAGTEQIKKLQKKLCEKTQKKRRLSDTGAYTMEKRRKL